MQATDEDMERDKEDRREGKKRVEMTKEGKEVLRKTER